MLKMFKWFLSLVTFYVDDPAAGGGAGAPAPIDGGTGLPAAATWYDGFANPEVKAWVGSYKDAYPNPEKMAEKAWNLEKFITAEKAGRGVVMPKPDAPAVEWRNFYAKVGAVPEKPEGYLLPKALEKDPVMLKFQQRAHSIGMPASHWKDISEFMAAESEALGNQSADTFAKTSEAEMLEVRTAWGAQYDAKVDAGQRAAAHLIPHTSKTELEGILHKMEGALGAKFTMNFWASLGEKIGEHGFVGGDNPQGEMTAEAARVEIANLQKDRAFAKKVSEGDAEAKAHWDKLNRLAFSQGAQVLAVVP